MSNEVKVSNTLVDPNQSDFGISQSKIILNERSGNLFTRDIYGQVRSVSDSSNQSFIASGSGHITSTTVAGAINELDARAAVFDTDTAVANFREGIGAASKLTTGHDNFAIGLGAGENITTGIGNIAIGHSALGELTTGINNTAIGWDSQFVNVIGTNNTSLGEDALKFVLSDNNTGIGYTAGYSLSTGVENTFVAPNCGYNNVTGSDNTGVGYSCMQGQSGFSFSQNTAVGAYSLKVIKTGSNTAVGYASGIATTTGVNNVFIGDFAGFANTSGSDNVCVGHNAGFFETSGARLFIDNSRRTDLATARIQSIIYGEFNSTLSSQVIRFNAGQVQAAGDGNGSTANIKCATTLLSAVSGATVTASNLIPAKAFLIGVSTRITTALGTGGGTTGFTVGDGSDADRFGAQVATTLGSTTSNADATADPTGWASAARSVVLTAVGGNFNGTGAVRVTVHYFDNSAPSA